LNKHTLFTQAIESSTAHRPIRDTLSGMVLHDPELLPVLIGVALDVQNKNHHKAGWILELVLENNIECLVPYLDVFCRTLSSFSNESSIRSISKICMFAAKYHLKKKATFLTENQVQLIIETCFDWLITDTKVASKVYAMRALFEFGKLQDWIYPELQEILPKDFANQSAGYHSASKKLLQLMAKVK
jgi:hypothetical protein